MVMIVFTDVATPLEKKKPDRSKISPSDNARVLELDIDAKIFQLDIDLDLIVDLRINEHRSKRSMAPGVGRIERRDAHQPMHADFRLAACRKRLGPLTLKSDGLDSRTLHPSSRSVMT